MTSVGGGEVVTSGPGAGPARAGRRRRAILLASTVVVLCICGFGAWFAHWRNDLQYFAGHGDVEGADHLSVNKTIYFGAFVQPFSDGRTLDIQSLTPVVTTNTAHATIRVLVCEPTTVTDTAIGAAYSLTPYCSDAFEFRPGRYRLSVEPGKFISQGASSPRPVSLVVAITPTRAGHVYIAGFRINYSDGIRHGSQQTGVDMEVRTRGR